MAPKDSNSGTKNRKSEKKDEYLSEEDFALKEQLELYVKMVQDSDLKLQKDAVESLRQRISSMDSSKKVLKFLRPHYRLLQAYYGDIEDSSLQKLLADILSVLASTMSPEGESEILKYRLLGSEGDIGLWGHEYIRSLAGEIGQEFQRRLSNCGLFDYCLLTLVEQIVVFYMKQNTEHEAVDLIIEAEDYDVLVEQFNNVNYKRACLYLTSLAKLVRGLELHAKITGYNLSRTEGKL